MEIKRIRLTDLELNRGQVEGLPSNPRQWGKGELDDLVKSIRETPELLEARGLIVWPYAGKYVILGGNMRFSALREMNAVDAPCMVMPQDTPMKKLCPGAIINPLGDWTGGPDVDSGATNRKLGSDMAQSVTGGGLHGKDLSKADVSVNIYAFLKAQATGEVQQFCCAIGDDTIDGRPYAEIVEIAREFIHSLGGFEKFAEWGLY